MKKEIKATFDPSVKKANEAHKEATGKRKEYLKPVEDAERQLGLKLSHWVSEQKRKAEDERRKKEDELKKQQEAEALAQAEHFENQGMNQEAEQVIEQAQAPVFVPEQKPVQKVEGVSYTTVWDFEILDPNLIPRMYLMPDVPKIRQVAKALKENAKIPGVRVFSKQSTRVRG